MIPEIVQVAPMENYIVYVYFEDGKIVCYDVKPLLEKEVFKPLKNPTVFKESCTILNDTLAWDIQGNRDPFHCIDIDPETLYALPMAKEEIA